MSTAGPTESSACGEIRRHRSRLQMHAPSSIKVVQPSGSFAEWKVAIPLLSPLDIVSIPLIGDLGVSKDGAEAVEAGFVGGKWRHPAEPFFYDPAPAPSLVLPRCS
ncbi:hypothetical protein HPP92_022321 [Vanilla planifolia]|uniref:Uncharacterized protein n=1 Tax=Vanilla planifolia TaxID=51239 RepID=A0A835PUI9_VANPL|nr:hypothetical protein HPP92_022626 [Vanilla planifolia]KAG0459193.1 hypothetical protein HPP92_022321 [Vanilla planifolia]